MTLARTIAVTLLLATGPSVAQPIIIPLQGDKKETEPSPPPTPSAPPVAPPVAAPATSDGQPAPAASDPAPSSSQTAPANR